MSRTQSLRSEWFISMVGSPVHTMISEVSRQINGGFAQLPQ